MESCLGLVTLIRTGDIAVQTFTSLKWKPFVTPELNTTYEPKWSEFIDIESQD